MGSKQHCFPTCSCPFSLTTVATLDASPPLTPPNSTSPAWWTHLAACLGGRPVGYGRGPHWPRATPFPLLVPSTMGGRIATNHAMGLSSDPGVSTSQEGGRDIRTFPVTGSRRLKPDLLSLCRGEHWWCGLLPLQFSHSHSCQHHSPQPQQL